VTPNRRLFCCGCQADVQARLTSGAEIYPLREDLNFLPFWKCDTCGNFVGCHHKTADRTRPLGCIPTQDIRNARNHIHRMLDPLWKSGEYRRRDLYSEIGRKLGIRNYHTAEIRSIDQAREVHRIVAGLSRNTPDNTNSKGLPS
jgi:hypothetical protein